MKQLALLTILSVIPLFFPPNSFAQSFTLKKSEPVDCWQEHMASAGCTPGYTACALKCPGDAGPAQRACEAACSKASQACRDESLANYRACVNSSIQTSKLKEVQSTQSSAGSISSDPNKLSKYLAQYRIAVEDEAEKIVSIKECGAGLPSQNVCIAEKLNSIDTTVTGIDSFPVDINTNSFAPIKPVILNKDANREIVGFQQESIPASVDLLDVISAGTVFDKESASAPSNGTQNSVIFKGEMIEVYTPEGQWKPVIVGEYVRPESTIVIASGGRMYYSQLNIVGGVGQTSYMTFGGAKTDAVLTQEKYSKLFYDLKFGSATFDTSKSDKNVEVRTPLTITKSKNTKFAVLYDPEKLYAATIIYEGEVEVIDILSQKSMILKPTDGGKPRMVIVPLVKTEEKTQEPTPVLPVQSNSGFNIGMSIAVVITVVVLGYVLFRKKSYFVARYKAIRQKLRKS